MPKAKYESIYHDLKHKIEQEEYAYQDLMPSENRLTEVYGCSRNTIRRALSELASIGYLQPMHGKGVRVIYTPVPQSEFLIGGIESFKESAARNHLTTHTKVIRLEEISATRVIAKKTGFPEGSLLYELSCRNSSRTLPLRLRKNPFTPTSKMSLACPSRPAAAI